MTRWNPVPTMPRAPAGPVLRCALVGLVLAGCSTLRPPTGPPTGGPVGAVPVGEAGELWRWTAPVGASVGMPAVASVLELATAGDGLGPAVLPDDRPAPRRGEQVAFTYGHVGVVLLDGAGHELWQARRVGVRDVAPLVTARSVLVATDDGLAAFGRGDGRPIWDVSLHERANTPALLEGMAVTTTWDGSVVALDPADGSELWRASLPGPALAPAGTDAIAGVVASWDTGREAGVVALTARGAERWAVPVDPGGVSGPALVRPASGSGPLVVVVGGDLAAHGLSAADGTQVWRSPLGGSGSPEVVPWAAAGPAGRGLVVAGHRLGGFTVLSGADGAPQWAAASDGAAVRGGPVFAAPGPSAVAAAGAAALPLDDGRVLVAGDGWRREWRPGPGRVGGLAVTAGGLLLVSTRGPQPAALVALSGWDVRPPRP